jgi:two-component SAPR family response regulator
MKINNSVTVGSNPTFGSRYNIPSRNSSVAKATEQLVIETLIVYFHDVRGKGIWFTTIYSIAKDLKSFTLNEIIGWLVRIYGSPFTNDRGRQLP